MVRINWTDQAVFDLKEIKYFISKDSKYYAQKTIEKLRFRTQILKEFPESGRIIPEIENPNFRELIEGSYRIMYKIVDLHRIDILTVFHTSRDFK
jgi:toxin ParE1/3/4